MYDKINQDIRYYKKREENGEYKYNCLLYRIT